VATACAGVVLACAVLQWEPVGSRRTAPIEGATAIGAAECGVCHEEIRGHEKIAAYHSGCESCHGGGSLHAESEAVEDIRHPSNADCLACHGSGRDSHFGWSTGEHARAGLFCSDCHDPHLQTRKHLRTAELRGLPKAAFPHLDETSGLCIGCHRDVGNQLQFPSHHPVGEGAMSCTSCHDPHEDRSTSLGGRIQLCAGCHQDYVGPWIFEHPPVVEDCSTCHDPHGAVTENLLETIQPAICLSCHPLNDTWHHDPSGSGILDNRTISQDRPLPPPERIVQQEANVFLNRCTDCHGAIHGSLTDQHLTH
jgi:DmsE family decaheme c-type cytochrome